MKKLVFFFLLYFWDKVLFLFNIVIVVVYYLYNYILYEILRWLNGCGFLNIILIFLKKSFVLRYGIYFIFKVKIYGLFFN